MRYHIIAVGRMQAGPERDLMQEYLARLPGKPPVVTEVDLKKTLPTADKRKKAEAERLLAAIPSGAAVIALDERGKPLTSRALAAAVDTFAIAGQSEIAVIIGGADGLDASVRQRADLTLALGSLTWPHMLVRAMLAEQMYRVHTILSGHPYHRD